MATQLVGNQRACSGNPGAPGPANDPDKYGAAFDPSKPKWFVGDVAPAADPVGSAPGDFYLDEPTGDVYEVS